MGSKLAKDLRPGNQAWLKGEWRTVRGVTPVSALTDDGIKPTNKVSVVWDPGAATRQRDYR